LPENKARARHVGWGMMPLGSLIAGIISLTTYPEKVSINKISQEGVWNFKARCPNVKVNLDIP
jgi:hypothetical protein